VWSSDMQGCAVEEPGCGFARGRLEEVWSRICKGSEGNSEALRGISELCSAGRARGAVSPTPQSGAYLKNRAFALGRDRILRSEARLHACPAMAGQIFLDAHLRARAPLRIPRRAGGNGAGEGESTYRQIAYVAIKKADQYHEGEINSLIIDSDSETRHLMARFRKPH